MIDEKNKPITFGSHLRLIEENTSVRDSVYGKKVQVKGYKITVKIERLTNDHFVKYIFKAKNNFGHSIHVISVLFAG